MRQAVQQKTSDDHSGGGTNVALAQHVGEACGVRKLHLQEHRHFPLDIVFHAPNGDLIVISTSGYPIRRQLAYSIDVFARRISAMGGFTNDTPEDRHSAKNCTWCVFSSP
jgi:hypothetical protein